MKRLWLTLFTVFATIAASPALAQSASSDPTAHRHVGFFLQMDAGPGYLTSSTSGGSADLKLHGAAFDFSISIGGAVTENFIVAGRFWDATAPGPTLDINGQKTSIDADVTRSGIGIDFVYYFMPANIYVSASPFVGTLTVQQDGVSTHSKSGLGFRAAVGKEWWVSDHWGVGINGQMALASNKDKDASDVKWGTFFGGIAFSATYD